MVFVTLAVGQPYLFLARDLLLGLAGAGNEVIAVTSSPCSFPNPIVSLKCPDDGAPIWHRKRFAVKAGLERSREVIFIDADYQLKADASPVYIGAGQLPNGFSSGERESRIGNLWFDKKFLDLATQRFHIDWRDVTWWGCSLFAVSDDGSGLGTKFVDGWDEWAHWAKSVLSPQDWMSNRALSDCAAMAFAARMAGTASLVFGQSRCFDPITVSYQHLRVTGTKDCW